jgi:hypothetical protein
MRTAEAVVDVHWGRRCAGLGGRGVSRRQGRIKQQFLVERAQRGDTQIDSRPRKEDDSDELDDVTELRRAH